MSPNEDFTPNITCSSCVRSLDKAMEDPETMCMTRPMIWRKPTDHFQDCYFCLTDIEGHNRKSMKNIVYANVGAALKPVYRTKRKKIPKSKDFHDDNLADPDYSPEPRYKVPKLFTQEEADDLVRDLYIPKHKAELLSSRLKEKNLVTKEFLVSSQQHRNDKYVKYFRTDAQLTYCCNILALLTELGYPIASDKWRLFIDSSKSGLKGVLLHNGNRYPAIPIAYSSQMNETRENLTFLLQKTKYEVFLTFFYLIIQN
jgi:hypothetical protein